MKTILSLLVIVPNLLFAQAYDLWKQVNGNARISDKWSELLVNRKELNPAALEELLKGISESGAARIAIFHPSGSEMLFDIVPSRLLSPELQAKYPEIQTFKGFNSEGETARITITSSGLHGMIYTQDGAIMIEPERPESTNHVSYFKSDYFKANDHQSEFYEEPGGVSIENLRNTGSNDVFKKRSMGGQMKKYRIAIAADGGFTSHYGGKAKTMEAIVAILDLITGIFEKDLAITFELIAENDQLIYSAGSDPYDDQPQTLTSLRTFNQEHLDEVIGFDNYDLGILLSATGNSLGGQASAGHVCRQLKSTAIADFNSTVFQLGFSYISTYVGHEIGHQFEALHSWSGRCTGSSTSSSTSFTIRDAYEPGSGSTIMSYAGFCGESNVESNSGDYFHAVSSEYILTYIEDKIESCAIQVETGNLAPTVQVSSGEFVIPINTPFVLDANGEDGNGDELTYCWEQFDQTLKQEHLKGYDVGPIFTREELEEDGFTETQINTLLQVQEVQLAAVFEGDGPLFRSFPPSNASHRYFPQLDEILAGDFTSNVEVLPFKSRDLNFVVTVRDNLGGMTNDLVSFSSSDQAGPFVVTSELTESSYAGLSSLTVAWDVANTNTAPVNCRKVDILYSTDGGESFDIVVLGNTDNDGSATIQLPNIATSTARIMVQAVDNIFFNVNDRNFTVISSEVAAPEAPNALIGNRVNGTSVNLSWTHGGELEDGFTIERKLASATDFEQVGQTSVNTTTYTNTAIEASETYEYRVAAFNTTGNSDYSNILTIEAVKETDILSFSLPEQTGSAMINSANRTVEIEVATGTDASSLAPVIALSEGATSSPASGVEVDFSDPVTYTVTAVDGVASQDWTVTVTVEEEILNDNTEILSFQLSAQTGSATINSADHTVKVEVAAGTDITLLTPTIVLSEGAASFPSNGAEVDFTKSVIYVVTAEDGEATQEWEVSVVANDIKLFAGSEEKLEIYPNPVTDVLSIKTQERVKVYLTDIFGRRVIQEHFGNDIELDMSGLVDGMYLLLMQYGNDISVTKIIKSKESVVK